MNLERFTEEVQALIIQSVADEVLNTMKGVILVIPEAWKFLPQKYNSPCKRVVISFARQGATNENFIWIDSQDMSGVDKEPLKQLSNWGLGYQQERNEVKHTLDQISLPKKSKPTEDEIMNLKKGHFIFSGYEGVTKVYVQPIWMDDLTAVSISKGEKSVEDVKKPENLVPFARLQTTQQDNKVELRFDDSQIRKDINELRIDFFNKIQELQNFNSDIASKVYALESNKVNINEQELIAKVLQKIPINNVNNQKPYSQIDEEMLINKIIARVPSGAKVYQVAPLEKLKMDYLEQTKQLILAEINSLSDKGKHILKWIEANGKQTSRSEIVKKLWNYTTPSNQNNDFKIIEDKSMCRKDSNGRLYPNLKEYIKNNLSNYNPSDEEIEQVYNHILMEMLQ